MYTSFGNWMFLSAFIYLIVIIFLVWLGYRFVRAHESIANSLENIDRKLSELRCEEE